jgi:methylmalonyl-CoA mutase
MEKLFSQFKPSTAQDWKQQVIKDLKGADFEKLVWHRADGIDVQPFYTAGDTHPEPVLTQGGWEICEEITVKNEQEANQKALKALSGGASSLHFFLSKMPDLNVLLRDVSIEHIELCFILRFVPEDFRTRFHSYAESRGVDISKLRGAICYDGIARLAETGHWLTTSEHDLHADNSWVDASLYQNAGATQSFELACALAHAHEYLTRLEQKKKFRFTISVGSDFFGEIAKLRALRKLWPLIAKEYRADEEIWIHAVNTGLNQSALDAYNNMLRSTTEGMSAVIGGCNSLTLEAYNKSFESTREFGERIARNQQMIYKEESYLDKVADMGAGSYYIETLTDLLAEKAWEEFKEIESRGGFIACLEADYIQVRIRQQAEQLIHDFREEKVVLVGVNKFQNKNETRPAARNFKRITTNTEVMPITKISLSDYQVKENA